MYCILIASVKRSLLLQCTFVALACCILVPGMCSADDGKEEAFLDAQELVDGWQANYGHIDSFKVRCSTIPVEEKGHNPNPRTRPQFFLYERIQDGGKFFSRYTRCRQGFDGTGDYAISSFDGRIGKEFTYMSDTRTRQAVYKVNPDGTTSREYVYGVPRGGSHADGTIYRGSRGRDIGQMNLLADFLGSLPGLSRSEKGQPSKVMPTEQYPLGIPTFIAQYNRALEINGVLVRPYLESVAGEPCHVLELYFSHGDDAFWLAHEKGMLLMKKKYVPTERKRVSTYRATHTEELKQIASVTTEKGVLWYPRVITDERIWPDHSYTTKVTVHEFVPYFKAPAETFNYVFPNGTHVRDRIRDMRYTVGESKMH